MANAWQKCVLHRLAPLGWAALLATPFVCHAAIADGRLIGLALLLAAGQAAALLALALRQRRRWLRWAGTGAVLLAAAAAGVFAGESGGGRGALMLGAGLSHAAIHASLLVVFGRSLAPGRTPLVTILAQRMRGTLTPEMQRYTRAVTGAWCAFFAAQLVLSGLLLAFASPQTWSLFVNVLDGGLIAAMMAGEYAVRRWRFRHVVHASPIAGLRAFARARVDG